MLVEQDGPAGIGNIAEQILSIIEALLQGAGATMKLGGTGQEEEESQLEMLLNIIKMPYVVSCLKVVVIILSSWFAYYCMRTCKRRM